MASLELSLGAYILLGTQAVTLLGAVASLIQSIRNGKVGQRNGEAIQQLSINVDGRLSELLQTSKLASHAEGRLEGIGSVVAAQENGK